MSSLDAFHDHGGVYDPVEVYNPNEVYNPDQVIPVNSPLQKVVDPRLDPTSDLPVLIQGDADVDDFHLDTPWAPELRVSGRTVNPSPRSSGTVLPSPADTVLLHQMGNGKIPSIGWFAQSEMLDPAYFDSSVNEPYHCIHHNQPLRSNNVPNADPKSQLSMEPSIDGGPSPESMYSPSGSYTSNDSSPQSEQDYGSPMDHDIRPPMIARRRLGVPLSLPRGWGKANVMSCADTGADENAMTVKEAFRLGLPITSEAEDVKKFFLANGKIIKPLGKAISSCNFSQGYASPDALVTIFYVFQTLVEPIIMGLKFLELTETLSKHRDRLVELEVPPNQPLRVLSMGVPRRNLACRLAKNTVFANVDSGSDLNFVSGKYARTHNLALIPNRELIELADGTQVTTSGVVKLPLSVGELDTHDMSGINIIRHLKNMPISKSIRNVFRRRRSRQSKKTGAPLQDGDEDQMENARHSMEIQQTGNGSTVAHQPQLQPLHSQEATTSHGLAVPVTPVTPNGPGPDISSPTSEINGHTSQALPSMRAQVGDLLIDKDNAWRRPSFTPQTPPGLPGMSSMPGLTSPTSPDNPYTHSMPSPASVTSIYPTPYGSYPSNGFLPRSGPDYIGPVGQTQPL